MNIFRLCGDMSHVFSIIVLLLRLRVAKNASGELVGYPAAILCLRLRVCLCSFDLEWPTAPNAGDEIFISQWRRGTSIGVGIVIPCGGREAMPAVTLAWTLIFGHEFSY